MWRQGETVLKVFGIIEHVAGDFGDVGGGSPVKG